MGTGKSVFSFTNKAITLDGESTTINITIDNVSYSHKLAHKFGTIAVLPVGSNSYTWTPTASELSQFFEEVPNQKTVQIEVYLYTYNGSEFIGRDTHMLSITLSADTGKPYISDFIISDSNSITKGMNIIIIGKSVLTETHNIITKYGATIQRISYIKRNGNLRYREYPDINTLISVLPLTSNPSSQRISIQVVDSRGFTEQAFVYVTCVRYVAPKLDTINIIRCDTSGNSDTNGTKIKMDIKGSWGNFDNKNPATLKVGYKKSTDTEYTYLTISVTDGVVDYDDILNATILADYDYLFSVILKDSFESFAVEDLVFSNNGNILTVSPEGDININSENDINVTPSNNLNIKSYGMNMESATKPMCFKVDSMSEDNNTDCMKFEGSGPNNNILFTNANLITDIQAFNDKDCNSLLNTGRYYILTGCKNMPALKHGWLSVMEQSNHCYQTFVTYDGIKYERIKQSSNWSSWQKILSSYVLFDNDNAVMSDPVTLSDTSVNYDELEIFYKSNDNFYSSVKVYKPNGKRIALVSATPTASAMYSKSRIVEIKGVNIGTLAINSTDWYRGETNAASNAGMLKSDVIAITKVIGWR